MKFETVLNALVMVAETTHFSKFDKFRAWILRHEEKQRVEIDHLQKQLSTERSLVNNAPVWAEMGNCPPDTVIGIRYEQIIKWQAEIERLNHALDEWENYKPDDQDLFELAQQARSRDNTYTNGLATQCVYICGLEAYLRQKGSEIASLQAKIAKYSEALSYFTTMNQEQVIKYFTGEQ